MTGYDHGGTEAGDGAAAPAPPGHPTTAHLTSQYGSTFFTWILVHKYNIQITKYFAFYSTFSLLKAPSITLSHFHVTDGQLL